MTDHEETRRKKPTGRRVGDSGTRDAILDAALALFSERGFEGASLRAIAAEAGVDPGLIRHFFGDKDSLFIETVSDRTMIPSRIAAAFPGESHDIGRRVTDNYLRLWDDPQTGSILLALARSAATSPRAAAMMRDLLGARVGETIGMSVADPRARGIALAASHLLGVAFARHVVRLPALVDADRDTLVREIAPTVQGYLEHVGLAPTGGGAV
ncbi:TetR/AcrR family transcriptional regulator [Isoptericola sp. NPDC055881]